MYSVLLIILNLGILSSCATNPKPAMDQISKKYEILIKTQQKKLESFSIVFSPELLQKSHPKEIQDWELCVSNGKSKCEHKKEVLSYLYWRGIAQDFTIAQVENFCKKNSRKCKSSSYKVQLIIAGEKEIISREIDRLILERDGEIQNVKVKIEDDNLRKKSAWRGLLDGWGGEKTHVKSYYRKDGTRVRSHMRSK